MSVRVKSLLLVQQLHPVGEHENHRLSQPCFPEQGEI